MRHCISKVLTKSFSSKVKTREIMPTISDHNSFANLIWQIADLLRGPYRPPQYDRVMLPMTVLRRFDCLMAPTKAMVLAEFEKRKGGKLNDDALDRLLNKASGQRFHNHSPLDFERLKGDPDNIENSC
jgi:type I restriction enzyme M protein